MNYKKKILFICLILCIFSAVSSVYAIDENITYDSVQENVISQNLSQSQVSTYDDSQLSVSQNDDVLAATAIYFDASANWDGDGSKSNPYKYLKGDRISYGTIAYFADGTYELSDSLTISSSETYKTVFVGESIQNTIIKSKLSGAFDFIVNRDSYFGLTGLTLDNIHISNQATLIAENVSFVNSAGFTEEDAPRLTYLYDEYDSTYGGVIICNTPPGKTTSVILNKCSFANDYSINGGVIAAFNSSVHIQNCIFYNSSSTRFGGVVYSSSSDVVILNSSFSKNRARYGGVVYSKGTTLKIYDSDFENTQANSFGGVIVSDSCYSVVSNCTFNNYESQTDAGGAIYSMNSTLKVYDSSFKKGRSFFGGAICNLKTNLTLLDSVFSHNEAVYYGGSIYNVYGVIGIQGNVFEDSHADSSGGSICSRLSDYLFINNNTFVNSTAAYGHIIFVDGDEGSVVEKNNVYHQLYNLVCVYSGNLNGEGYATLSNYLTFSVSNNGVYVMPLANGNGPVNDNYARMNISVEGYPSPIIYTDIDQNNRILFDLEKYGNSFTNEFIEAYIIDEAGDIIYSDIGAITINENHIHDILFDLNFKNFMISVQYGNLYDVNPYTSVPLFNYTVAPQSLPVAYDSRDYGYITPVKDQKEGGNCWAFSGIATLEACLKKATGITYDFSEENAKNLMAAYSLFGWDIESNDGGNLYMFMAYLASWFGPVNDADDVYDDYSSLSVIYDAILHIQDIYCIPERRSPNDNELVKRAIMDYGAVSVSTQWDKGSHAITLVGWDDEYTGFDYFNTKSTGAWIFKNSWGEEWYDNGYFYLSYEKEFKNAYTFIFNEDRGYSDIYQYDFSGVTGYKNLPNTDVVYSSNKFVSASNDILTAVSTFFYDPTQYSISVYLNDKLVSTQDGYTEAGYYTFPLAKEIQLAKGDEFTVEFKIYGNNGYKLPICMASVINKVTFNDDTSFYSVDGRTWYDLYYSSSVACIKAFTRSPTLRPINIDVEQFDNVKVNEMVNIVAIVPEYYVVDGYYHYIKGFVTFNIDGKYYYAPIKDGKASLNVSFSKEGIHTLTAYYKSNLEISNTVMFNFNVVAKAEEKISLQASDVSKYYGGPEKYAVYVTSNDLPLSGASVKISVANKVYTVKTNSDGWAILDLNLTSGTYGVVSEYDGISVSSKFIVKSTIDAKDASGPYLQTYIVASFLDTTGNFLSDEEVILRIGNTNYKARTTSSGYLFTNIDLDAGTYEVTVINPVTGEQRKIKLEIFKRTVDMELTTIQNGKSIIVTASLSSANATGYVNFIFNGNNYVEVENGVASWEVYGLDEGTYDILASYTGDDNFYGIGSHLILTVESETYTLKTFDLAMYYGDYSVLLAEVVDEEGIGVSGQTVRFTIGNKTYTEKTDSDGLVEVQIPALDVGNYTFLVEYETQSSLANLEVSSTILLVDVSSEYLQSGLLALFIRDWNKTLDNEEVIFKIGQSQFKVNTDSEGYVNLDLDLDVGLYTIVAVNPATGEEKQFEIQITKTTPQITLTKSQTGNEVTLTASLKPTAPTGNVVFTVGSTKYTIEIENGKAVLTLTDLSEGNYSAIAKYVGDTNFNNALSSPVDFTVLTPRITITAPDLTKMFNGDENFTITVKNNDVPVKGAVVICTFDGEQYEFETDRNGEISVGIEDFDSGEYYMVSEYGGVSVTSKVTILSTISAVDVTTEYPNAEFKASFLNTDSKALSNTEVTFYIGNKQYKVTTNSNGVASVKADLDAGEYTVTAVNPVNDEFKRFKLNVLKATPQLALQYQQNEGVVTLTAGITPKSVEGAIVFNVGTRKNTITLKDGNAILDLMGLNAGSYVAFAEFSGNSNYNDVSTSMNFTVSKITPTLTLSMTTVEEVDALMAKLSHSTATGQITFIVDGEEYTVGMLNGESYLTFSAPGTYDVLVKYSGDGVFNPVSASKKVIIEDTSITYLFYNLNKVYGDSKTFDVVVVDSKGNPVSKEYVGFSVYKNGNLYASYETVTGTDGYASLTCNYVPSTYYVKVSDGESVLGEAKLVVSKATPKITASAKTFKIKTKTKKYTITLKSNLNKALKNKKVTIKVGGKTYTAKTTSSGKATFKITKLTKKGKFTAVVKFGDSYYKTISKKVKITVK